eukprot:2014239-Rhodomonas_salina.2
MQCPVLTYAPPMQYLGLPFPSSMKYPVLCHPLTTQQPVLTYAAATRCPVLTRHSAALSLQTSQHAPRTPFGHPQPRPGPALGTIVLRACYAMSGTDVAYR